jgi:hypothetical protein
LATLTKKNVLTVARLKGIFEEVNNDALHIAKACGDLILERALPLTPMESGKLRESGRVEMTGTGKNIQVRVAFGNDDDVNYAAVVHEDLNSDKHFTVEGTGPKYLEQAVNESKDEIESLIGNLYEQSIASRARS